MDGLYLASNLKPLLDVEAGEVLKKINEILKDRNEKRTGTGKGEIVAYRISSSSPEIMDIDFLIENNCGLFYRPFNFYKSIRSIDDAIPYGAKYGFGFMDLDVERFMKLRDFYLQNKEVELSR
jgi:hypothetical protein